MQQPLSMMFDDDDGVEPQFEAVDGYYFEHGKEEPVCFSVLPLHFDNDEVKNCDSEKKVYLRGMPDKSLYLVHKRVVAWRVELDCEQPKISVLSSVGNWITILRPRKCYEKKIARSVLITVQILQFIKKHSGDEVWGQLWDHLYEVFNKLDSKPSVDDLRAHLPLIRLFVGRDQALIKSKILRRLIEDTAGEMKEPKTRRIKAQFNVSVESCSRSKDDDDKNDCDYSCTEDDSDDEYSYSESSTEDDYSSSESKSNVDESTDGDIDNDDSDCNDCTDAICALCDDGGKLLSCIGACKRSFHPRVKDGRESKCITLGYTSAQLKGFSDFLCRNCKYKQHQCFKCGQLEPSDELNAKVFKCNNASCGHFYHPKCVAKLLEPDDGLCELAKRIMSGMSFTCPVHWCFKCGKMDDRTQRALQFAVCRHCPKSYHRDCLPRYISFESKGKRIKQRAWELSDNILIYCRDHRIYRTAGTAGRNHIKFPSVPEDSKPNYPVTKKVKTSGSRKMGMHHHPIKCTKSLNRLCAEEIEQHPRLTVINPEHVAKSLREGSEFEPSMVGFGASTGSLETEKGLEKQFDKSSFAKGSRIQKDSSCAVGIQLKNRVMSKADKGTSSGISHDIARKRVTPSTLGIYGPSNQDILSANSPVEKDAKDDGERDKTSGEENGAPNEDFHDNHEQNGLLGNLSLNKHAEGEGGELNFGKEGGMEGGYNEHDHNSVSGQEKKISTSEQDTGSENAKVTSNGSNKCGSGNDKVTSDSDHIDDHSPQKPVNIAHVDTDTQPECGCAGDQEVNGNYDCQVKRNSSQSNNKCGSQNDKVTSDHIDDHSPQKPLNIARVDTDTQPECGCAGDQEVNGNYDCQVKRNSSQSNKNLETIDIDITCDNLRKSRETKEKATDSNKVDLNKNRKYSHRKNGEEDPCDGTGHVDAEVHSKKQCHANHKELDVVDCKFKGSGIDSPWYNGEHAAADISKSKSKRRTVSNRRDKPMCTGANSSKLPVARNARKRLRKYSPGQDMYHRDNYPKTSNRHRYEPKRHVDRRQRNPRESAFSPEFGVDRRRSPPPYLERQENGTTRRCARVGPEYISSRRHNSPSRPRTPEYIKCAADWDNFDDVDYDECRHRRSHVSPPYSTRPEYGSNRKHTRPFHPRSPGIQQHQRMAEYGRSPDIHPHQRMVEYHTSRRYSTSHSPRSEDVGYTLDWNSSPRLHYERYDNYEYGGYSEMEVDPVGRYSSGDNDGAYRLDMDVNMEERVAMYGVPVSGYGEGFLTPKASRSVNDKYAPRLDQTYHLPIGRSSLYYDLPPVRW